VKLLKSHINLRRLTDREDNYVDLPAQERLSLMWDITAEIWSLRGKENVERRLQRDITNLIKKQS